MDFFLIASTCIRVVSDLLWFWWPVNYFVLFLLSTLRDIQGLKTTGRGAGRQTEWELGANHCWEIPNKMINNILGQLGNNICMKSLSGNLFPVAFRALKHWGSGLAFVWTRVKCFSRCPNCKMGIVTSPLPSFLALTRDSLGQGQPVGPDSA